MKFKYGYKLNDISWCYVTNNTCRHQRPTGSDCQCHILSYREVVSKGGARSMTETTAPSGWIQAGESRTRGHDDVIKWEHFPRYCLFVWGIHLSPENSPHKRQWRGALIFFSMICPWRNGWANHRDAGDLRRPRANFHVTVMWRVNPARFTDLNVSAWVLSLYRMFKCIQLHKCNTLIYQWSISPSKAVFLILMQVNEGGCRQVQCVIACLNRTAFAYGNPLSFKVWNDKCLIMKQKFHFYSLLPPKFRISYTFVVLALSDVVLCLIR